MKRSCAGVLRFSQIARLGGFFRMTEARTILDHLAFIASGEKRESFPIGGTFKSKKTITINTCITDEELAQFLAAHAFDWITPKAFDCSNCAHKESKK